MLIGTLATPAMLAAPHAQRAELAAQIVEQGIDHVFVADHVSFHVGTGMDGLINAATLTALDPRLKVCVGVYLLALRHPVPVARQLATLAESSPGQLILGVGVGGEDRNEIAMCGVDPRTRGRRTDECLEVIQGLLGGEPMDHDGEFFQFQRGWIKPAPEPPIPMVIGGRADAALERAARFGDGWLGVWSSARRFGQVVEQVNQRAAALERPQPAMHGMQFWVGIDADRNHARARLAKAMEEFYRIPYERFEKYSPFGTPTEIAEFLMTYRDAGCRLFNIMPVAESDEAGIKAVAEIARLLRLAH
jgi:alkanesulfonate monooxygenase SsuD/methylene tetrahydromethanopterin reductase-like flavin-dependent oxidoreductase (luciferase family)